jgi:hypothetical protein
VPLLRTQHFSKVPAFALKGAVCAGSIHMHKSGVEVRVTARINVPKLRFQFFFLSTEEMDGICKRNISGLDVLEKRETSCYVGNPAVYLDDTVRSFPELSAVCLIRIRTVKNIHG